MRALVAARDWLTVFQLPPYASELNLIEGLLAGTRLDLTPSVTLAIEER